MGDVDRPRLADVWSSKSMNQVFEVKQYMMIWRQLEVTEVGGEFVKLRAIVRLIGDEYTLDVYFLAPDSPFPAAPVHLPEQKKSYLFMPIADFSPFADMIRYEKPIYAHVRTDKPEWTSVTTSKEPIGEGNTDMGN
jgi:hypothetical protein